MTARVDNPGNIVGAGPRRGAAAPPVPRVSGPDEAFLLAEEKLGYGTSIQYCWVLDHDPGRDAVDRFAEALSRGLLHRSVGPRRVPGAQRRWLRSPAAPQVISGARIDDAAIGAWADEVLRATDLRPSRGPAWRLHTTTTTQERRVVVLMASHLVADGEAIMRAIIAAADGAVVELPGIHSARGSAAVRADLRDSARQVRAAGRSARAALRSAREKRHSARPATTAESVSAAPTYDPYRAGLVAVDIDRDRWHACSKAHGGTGNTLYTAVTCGVVHRSGVPVGEQLRVSVAVSKRGGPEDQRANASGGVWLRIDPRHRWPDDLGYLRALSRDAFAAYATSGTDVPDDLQPLVRMMPRRVLGIALRSVPAPDVSVSNLGVLDEKVRAIGGEPASSFLLRLLVRDGADRDLAVPGPGLSTWIVEYGDRVTMTFAGFVPEYYGDGERLAGLVGDELSAWGLPHRFW
ncbi:hypothetical protein [Gordonia polyisoprenivorans]|uniref:hypothetical protein n=1 Tax=Gordonia polyisoprenivorans TaxID=84595 RepID=UPI001FCB783C|nr:hypothetical protein [Gordonia polyisoprenivorans]